MTTTPALVDRFGRPIDRASLKREIAGPTLTGVRSPMTGYPGDGLDPRRLAGLLRAADAGDPLRYLELAEQIEERDLHYVGVLGTRKRSVAQIEISVDAASDDAADIDAADTIRDWLLRDELADELFDILDAVGKGISFTEILWDTSEGQWRPARLEWRDPRWFRFARHDGRTPLLIGDGGQETALPPFKFVVATLKAKSGLPIRSGLARIAAWSWMFKAFTLRDWAVFTATFGQPVRVGRYGAGATEEDKETLFRAVANIAGDCAAIVPESMAIEFVEAANVGAAHTLYKERADWLDKQVSKAVLGQTATTDAEVGGLGSGREHRMVQEDIERADARALAAILNRDLVRPWMDLEFGPRERYPRIRIARPEAQDLALMAGALAQLVPLGLRVQASDVRDRFGLPEPEEGAELLAPPAAPSLFSSRSGVPPFSPLEAAPQRAGGTRAFRAAGVAEAVAERLEVEARPGMAEWLARIEAMLAAASSLEELREMLAAAFPDLDTAALAEPLALGLAAAHAAGRADAEDESG